jgi:hypothetical protein
MDDVADGDDSTHFLNEPVSNTMASLRRVLLLVRDARASAAFWQAAGLSLASCTDRWALLRPVDGGTPVELLQEENEALLVAAYQPLIQLAVEDVAGTVPPLLMAGGRLDGAIRHTPQGAIATLRSPDGHTLSLVPRALDEAAAPAFS